MVLKDRRDVKHSHNDSEFKKFKQYNDYLVQMDGCPSKFFQTLEDLKSHRETHDNKLKSVSYYESEVRISIRDATPSQKDSQTSFKDELQKNEPVIKNYECMNLLSQILMKQCKKFLQASLGKSGGSPVFIQTKLGIKQTAQTFEQLYRTFLVVRDIQLAVSDVLKSVQSY